MSNIKFIYMKNIYEIKYNEKDLSIKNLLLKYSSIIDININELLFLYKGNNLALNNKKKINELKDNNIIILVYNLKIKKNNNYNELKEIICPECHNLAIINSNNNKISLNCLANNHKYIDISIKCFNDIQYIDESLINCQICKNNKCYYNRFYINSNNKYFCPLCLSKNKDKIIDYDYRFNYCINHNLNYILYCNTCNINLCKSCEEKHKKHKIKYYKEIKPNDRIINEIKKDEIKINQCKEELRTLNNNFNDFINDLINYLDIYTKIYQKIINNSESNYESINNILHFKAKELISDISNFLKEKNKLKYIANIYENKKNEKKEMNIIYKIKENQKIIKLFGENFVKNNKQNYYLFINNKKCEICEVINLDEKENKKFIVIKLIENKNTDDMSEMFSGCSSLLLLPDISKMNINDVKNMSEMFYGCSSLLSLPDISKWNINNVKNLRYMFSECSSLSSLPDISKWNTNKVYDISHMFSGCSSLSSLPDISKWNTNKIQNMSNIFSGCSSLSSLPDISKWNTNNVYDMSYMFSDCSSLSSLPDISKWNTNKIQNMSHMFSGCSSLSSLPDISKWNTYIVTNMNYIFSGCSSLSSLPDISKWNTNKVYDISHMFSECSSLSSLPDISKWNINNVDYMSNIFSGCKNNLNYPKLFFK